MTLAALAAFARAGRRDREVCELCATDLPDAHDHVVDGDGRIRCVCTTCQRVDWRRISPRVERVGAPSNGVWMALGVPVGVAFIARTSPRDGGDPTPVIRYPSPAGLAQGDPSDQAWQALCAEVPEAAVLAPDVEAIVVDRRTTGVAFRVSIDHCYRLAGVLRSRGDLDAWFAELAGACARA
jgi:hypothetical protein